jgi:hypothetical protein
VPSYLFFFFSGSGVFGFGKPWNPNFIENDGDDFEPETTSKRVKIEKDEKNNSITLFGN